MSDDIDLTIRSRFDPAGSQAAARELKRLAQEQVAASRAQSQMARDASNAAKAQYQAAAAAQKLATEESRTAKETAAAAAAQARAEAATLRLASAKDKAATSTRRLGDGMVALPRTFAGLTNEVQAQVGALVGWGAAISAGVAVLQSFAAAFQLKADLDATTRSIEAQIGATRDFARVQSEAAGFAREFGFTQQETTAALAASVPILQSSQSSTEDILSTLARLAVLNPAEGIQGAAFALRELTSGDVLSLVERFNISKTRAYEMRDAIAAGGDAVQILSEYLDGAGVGMDTLATRTEGATGRLNELKQAQEELALAQAEWAQGPGLEILEVQIDSLRGATRLLSGDFETAVESLAANLAYYQTFAAVLAQTGDVTQAVTAATRAKQEALAAAAQTAGGSTGTWGGLNEALGATAGAGAAAAGGLGKAAAGADLVGERAAANMPAVAGLISLMDRLAGRASAAAGGAARTAAVGGMLGRGVSAVRTQTSTRAVLRAASIPAIAVGGGGGGGGTSAAGTAARDAEREAKAQDTASERVQDILNRQADFEVDLNQKRAAAAQDRAEKLADIAEDEADTLARITSDAAEKQADITASAAERRADVEAKASDRITDIRRQEAAAIRAIDARQAQDQANARTGLGRSISGGLAAARLRAVSDNLALAGSDDPALAAREAAQGRQVAGIEAAAQRAQGFGDATVGAAAFDAELEMLEARATVEEEYAARRAELEGDPAALAALDAQFRAILDAQQAYIEERIAAAEADAEIRREAAEQEKAEVVQRAKEERAEVEAEKRAQTATIIKEAEAQRVKVAEEAEAARHAAVTKAEEQREQTEESYAKQTEAINQWATDQETAIQRVIDKLDGLEQKAYDAAAAMAQVGTDGGGSTTASAAPTRHSGGPLVAGAPYRVRPNETAVFPSDGYMIPLLPKGSAAGGGAAGMGTVNVGGITIVQQPGEDAQALAERTLAVLAQRVNARGW